MTAALVRRCCLAAALGGALAGPATARAQTEAPHVPDETAAAPASAPPAVRPPPPAAPAPLPVTPPPLVEAPPVVPPQPPAPAPEPPPAPEIPTPRPAADEPLAGLAGGGLFLHPPGFGVVLFPTARILFDAYGYQSDDRTPNRSFSIASAQLGLTGWLGRAAYFSVGGDFAAGAPAVSSSPALSSMLAAADNFVAVAPCRDLVVLQAGQFDAPFTLENRTSEKHLDFMERSLTVRAFGVPDGREVGAMLWGTNERRNFFYSYGVFNGDGPGLRNADDQFDSIGRVWLAPFSFLGPGPLHDIEIGGSFWLGDRVNTAAPAAQTTQGGFTFLSFNPYQAAIGSAVQGLPVQLRQVGLMRAFAGELNAPINHRFGLRAELVWKRSPLSQEDVTRPTAPVILGGADLTGWSAYGELWFWALGDDRIIGDQQGVQPFTRLRGPAPSPARRGLMLAVRVERLDEEVTEEADAAALNLLSPSVGKTRVTSFEVGINYWRSKHFRATLNYVFNRFGGDTVQILTLPSPNEHELALRLGVAL
jgi:hypothetical protein